MLGRQLIKTTDTQTLYTVALSILLDICWNATRPKDLGQKWWMNKSTSIEAITETFLALTDANVYHPQGEPLMQMQLLLLLFLLPLLLLCLYNFIKDPVISD